MDNLIENGDYQDYADVISCAVNNLEVLRQEMGEGPTVLLGSKVAEDIAARPPGGEHEAAGARHRSGSSAVGRSAWTPAQMTAVDLPSLFARPDPDSAPTILAPLPEDAFPPGAEVPMGKWIFGQCNRLLPAKANCRALVSMLRRSPEGVELSKAAQRISEEALRLGVYLRRLDEVNGLGRDDARATAFPSTAKAGKGSLRYGSQFVARADRKGRVSGLMMELKLINRAAGGGPIRLLLTEPGWQFAALPNPILDAAMEQGGTKRFSPEEISFLLHHIQAAVPTENYAIRMVLQAILAGADTPEALGRKLGETTPDGKNSRLKPGFLASQRSGAVSRMADLGLITRCREGVRVKYIVSDRGNAYVAT